MQNLDCFHSNLLVLVFKKNHLRGAERSNKQRQKEEGNEPRNISIYESQTLYTHTPDLPILILFLYFLVRMCQDKHQLS